MGIAEDWSDLLFDLSCLSKQVAKRRFRKSIKYGWGGLCAYCRSKRASTLDHIRPKSKGGSSLRSNLIPACIDCNHSKGSSEVFYWFEQQSFYNEAARELIEEWIDNRRFIEEELDEQSERTDSRATLCTATSKIRSQQDEPPRSRKNSTETAQKQDGTEKRCTEYINV